MSSVSQALVAATRRLSEAGIPGAATDARTLLAHVLGVARGRLTLLGPDPLTEAQVAAYDALLKGRLARRPVSHLTGTRQFWGRSFRVTPDVLDPRPETEDLVALALQEPFTRVLDLGTGSGCILLSVLAERPQATGLGVDASEAALTVAQGNAQALGLTDRASFRLSDWFSHVEGRFDLILSNPPYITQAEMAELAPEVAGHEPHMALTPGGDGLSPYRIICAQAAAYLAPGGRVIFEIGHLQGAAVAALMRGAGFDAVTIAQDLSGKDRNVLGRLPAHSP
ncbi:peptide chain release factor N(5)-glutamine methyltransferase [Pseudoruegeria sp. SHC-113]|uniref:peptide chain release factor N(5)-glutamine methyltransferase n=1 Tax=Pseudoruegeria sp. SHC-113 TaxID=2855439 RepID=UPI0021BB2FFB|nr:peptide chain release factor N(5)-glutamine methyltransferase [Pseudoruegeria sp. SHC-113]MCT8160612.1 peptide chain release factor N(5)-glutamine methyltransferase [Pseudoruegeria sp. SHC-113]